MRIRLVTVGKLKERYLQDGVQEYLKRLRPYARVEMVTLPDEPIPDGASPAQEAQVMQREGERILRAPRPGRPGARGGAGRPRPEHVV